MSEGAFSLMDEYATKLQYERELNEELKENITSFESQLRSIILTLKGKDIIAT